MWKMPGKEAGDGAPEKEQNSQTGVTASDASALCADHPFHGVDRCFVDCCFLYGNCIDPAGQPKVL